MRETRALSGIELRQGPGGRPRLVGWAVVWDAVSVDLGGFVETFRKGAFTQSLKEHPDLRALVDHDASLIIGRVAAGTVIWKGPREWIYGFNASDPRLLRDRPNHALLWTVMRDAIARHGEAQRASEDTARMRGLATVEDALSIARDLNIPEEHVLAAVRERNLGKLREQRRASVRSSRQGSFFLWLGGAVGFSVMAAVATV